MQRVGDVKKARMKRTKLLMILILVFLVSLSFGLDMDVVWIFTSTDSYYGRRISVCS